MWSKLFLITSLVFTTNVIASNVVFIDSDNIFQSLPVFHRHHGYALVGHVIQTLSVFIADCLVACQKSLACFSYNYRGFQNGTYICELSRSNKKQSPGSFVRKDGYEYAEPKDKKYCEKNNCYVKDALPDDWYKFNTSLYKFISEKKTWAAARQHCQSLGGELASFAKDIYTRFVMAVSGWYPRLVRYKMDGSDTGLSLHNGAAVVDIDGTKAVLFDGVNDFATIPQFDIRTTDFTIAMWYKDNGAINRFANIINSRYQVAGKNQFTIYFYRGRFTVEFYDIENKMIVTGISVSNSEYPVNQWLHLAVTWNRMAKEAKVFYNGALKRTRIASKTNVDFSDTSLLTYEIGADDGQFFLKAWLKDLIVSKKTFTQDEIPVLKDGLLLYEAWIGLNDVTTEGTFHWSDGAPLTYTQSSTSSSNTPENDCVEMIKLEEDVFTWKTSNCNTKKVFICKKN